MLICVIFESIFLSYLFNNPLALGSISGYFDPNFGLFVRIYQITIYLIFGLAALIFIRESLKSDNLETKLKGKFLLGGYFAFLTGSILDIMALVDFPSQASIALVIVARILIFSCEILLYCGLTLPDFVKKLFIRGD